MFGCFLALFLLPLRRHRWHILIIHIFKSIHIIIHISCDSKIILNWTIEQDFMDLSGHIALFIDLILNLILFVLIHPFFDFFSRYL